MDALAASCPTPPPDNADVANPSPLQGDDRPLRSPDRPPASVLVQRQIMRAGAFGSPVRRSPRLSGLPPLQPPMQSYNTQDLDEHSDASEESKSVNSVTPHLSRENTPENDALSLDEPSTVLVDKIMRAHDNPSPPPQDLARSDANHVPGKDDQIPLASVSAPLDPLYPINLFERPSQLPDPPSDPSHNLRTPTLGSRPEISESGIISPRGGTLPEFHSPFITSVPMKSAPLKDLTSTVTVSLSPTQCSIDGLSLPSPSHGPADCVDETGADPSSQPVTGQYGQLASSHDLGSFARSPTQAIDSSSNLVVPTTLIDGAWGSPEQSVWQGCRDKVSPNTKIPSSLPSNEITKAVLATEIMDPRERHGEDMLSMDNNGQTTVGEEQESRCRATSTEEVNDNAHQRLDSLSPRSTNVLATLCLSSGPSSSIEQTTFPGDFIPVQHPPATPSWTSKPSVIYPDFSRSTIQRPVITLTPVRANNGPRKSISPTKSSFGVNDIYRTPAQRVPIESVLGCGISSLQKTVHPSTGSDQSQLGRFRAIRAPIFTRPALDGLSRSPAKRIPVTNRTTSPTMGNRAPDSPRRLDLRARSASVEPRPLRPILTRSLSVEPCTTISQPDYQGKVKEFVFPMVPVVSSSSSKLPFPLVSGQKSGSNLPASIPEEHETTEIGNTETEPALEQATRGNMISQLRQPSTNSRIPRIGNKPYARLPPKNGTATMNAMTAMVCAPRVSPFQPACKNNGNGNSSTGTGFTQPANDSRLVGSLKRKRGTEATAPPYPRAVMVRQVVPGILSQKYAPKPAKISHVQPSSPPKVSQPLKFRKVVDGMLSARYAPAKANLTQIEVSDSASLPLSPLSELSSSSNEEPSDEKPHLIACPPIHPKSETSDSSRTDSDASTVKPGICEYLSLQRDADGDEPTTRPRRTSRTRKPAQQQYVLDVFSANTSTRPPPARRKPQPRTEESGFMGMSATALRALTTSNTTKNQRTVAVLATEVIRKDGPRPESPAVKARTILQKQQDERDMRRKERALRRARMSEDSEPSNTEGQVELDDQVSPGAHADQDQNDYAMPPKHRRGPGDEEDYETPERLERIIEPLRLEGIDTQMKAVKQVKWHRGLLTAVYLDEVDPRPKSLSKDVVVRGCLAPTSKNLPLDPLGNLIDIDNRRSPELVTEQIVVKKYLYDNDIEPEPVPVKVTRSRGRKGKS